MERLANFRYPQAERAHSTLAGPLPTKQIYLSITSRYTNLKIYLPRILNIITIMLFAISSIIIYYILSNISSTMFDYCPSEQATHFVVFAFLFGVSVMATYAMKSALYFYLLVAHILILLFVLIILENRIMQYRIYDLSDKELQFFEVMPDKIHGYSKCQLMYKICLGFIDLAFIIDCFLLTVHLIRSFYLTLKRRFVNTFNAIRTVFRRRFLGEYDVSF